MIKTVLFFETSIATLNIGDEIINYSIKKYWAEIYKNNCILTMPTHTPNFYWWQNLIYKSHQTFANSDYKFLCGTNILYVNMLRPRPGWNIFLNNTKLLKNTVCLGVGIGKNSNKINFYTKYLYKKVLSNKYIHSVRDDAAKKLLEELGFKAYNTGCPTLWGLTPEHCSKIPVKKSQKVVFTLTSYQPDKVNDQKMIDCIKENYNEVYFWPQTFEDLEYLKSFKNIENIIVVAPNLSEYDEILKKEIDYIGNRLHGGIFALQHKCRTIIIGIDYRVEEMGKNFSLPYLMRGNIENELNKKIMSEWKTEIKGINFELIKKWKQQFE